MQSSAYTLIITANSGEELKVKVLEAASQYTGSAAIVPAPAAKEAPKSTEEKPGKAGKGGKTKPPVKDEDPFAEEAAAPAPAAAPEVQDDPFAEDEAPAPKAQLDAATVKAAIQKVSDTHPKKVEAAKEIIKALGVARVKDIQPEQYQQAMDLCDKMLKP